MPAALLQSFIHGNPSTDGTGKVTDVINPATGEIYAALAHASRQDIDAALESGKKAFLAWSRKTPIERMRILLTAAKLLRERNDELAAVEVQDTGKPWREASLVDVQTGADAIEYFANLAPSVMGAQQPFGDDFFYTRREPLGLCLGIGAWNYPLQIACWKSAPALAAGNSMIFKPSEQTPRSALELAKIFIEAGVPEGVFNVVQGDGEIGEALTSHPDIAKVSFTGEVETGKKVMGNAARNLKAVTMELGGKSPLIVFDDTDVHEAISAAMLANFYTQGEVCTHGTRVYVQRRLYADFITGLQLRVRGSIRVGDPRNPETNLGALISESHMKKVLSYIQLGLAEGASLLTGGERLRPAGCEGGYFVSPTVFIDCLDSMTICREEIFGPVMAVLVFDEEDEVISRANDSAYGLAAGVFTNDIRKAHRVVSRLEAGICWINTYGNSPVEMPVGGYKSSGLGRENGVETFSYYTQTKSVYVGMNKLESPF